MATATGKLTAPSVAPWRSTSIATVAATVTATLRLLPCLALLVATRGGCNVHLQGAVAKQLRGNGSMRGTDICV